MTHDLEGNGKRVKSAWLVLEENFAVVFYLSFAKSMGMEPIRPNIQGESLRKRARLACIIEMTQNEEIVVQCLLPN